MIHLKCMFWTARPQCGFNNSNPGAGWNLGSFLTNVNALIFESLHYHIYFGFLSSSYCCLDCLKLPLETVFVFPFIHGQVFQGKNLEEACSTGGEVTSHTDSFTIIYWWQNLSCSLPDRYISQCPQTIIVDSSEKSVLHRSSADVQ